MGCTQSKEKKDKKSSKPQQPAKTLLDYNGHDSRRRIHHGEDDETSASNASTSADSEATVDSADDKTVAAAAARRRTDNLGILASPSQQKIISRSTTPMRHGNNGAGRGFGNTGGEDDAADFSGMSPVNLNQTTVRQSDSASLLSESVKFRSCASRFGGGATATAMSSALINSQYFYSFATTENGESGTIPGVRIEYGSSHNEIYDPNNAAGGGSTISASQIANLHSPMSPSQMPLRRAKMNAANGKVNDDDSPPPPHIRTDTGALGPLSSSDEDGGLLKNVGGKEKSANTAASPAFTVASTAGLSMLSPQTLNTPGMLSDGQTNQFATAIHIRTQSAATNASVNTGGAAPTPRYYGSDEDTPTTTIYHEKLSALLSGPEGQTASSHGRLSPSTTARVEEETLSKAESDDGSDHDGSPTVDRLGKVNGPKFEAVAPVVIADTAGGSDDEKLEGTLGTGKKKKLEDQNATYINKLSVIAQGTDPASLYVKAKLAMGTERPKEGKGFDMSAFRVGCDSISVTKKPDFHLYNPATDPLLIAAKGRRASDASATEGATPTTKTRSTVTDEMSFADLLNPTSTWDLLHSIPDAVAKVNSGDLLYRFCAKKYKDLPLEERVEIASHINMTGFKDELAENDQPILDFVHNKNSVGPTQEGISAAAALDAKIAKQIEKDKKNGNVSSSSGGHLSQTQTPATEVEDINLDNVLVCVLRLVGIMPRVTSRDANVDCVMNTDFQRLLAAPDEVFEHIDRYRTFRKVKHIIPFVFSFRFQMTGSEVVDDETMAEHAHHHDAKPTRIVVTERTKKHRGTDSTIKSKAFFTFYDIPPRGISSITGKALSPELAKRQQQELLEVSERLGGQSPEDIPSDTSKGGKSKKQSKNTPPPPKENNAPSQSTASSSVPLIPEKPGGILCVHTAIIIRTSMPKVLAGMVEAVGNKMGKQATGQIFKVRQFLLERKLSGWPEMASGGDNPNVRFLWEEQ